MKECKQCHEIKDESEFQKYYVIDKIYGNKRYEYIRNICKICLAIKCREWRKNNTDKSSQCSKIYNNTNKDKIRIRQKKYYLNNRDSILEKVSIYRNNDIYRNRMKEYRTIHKDELANKRRIYETKNKDKIKEKRKEYVFKNKDKINERKRRYAIKNKDKLKALRKLYADRINNYRKSHRNELNAYARLFFKTDAGRKIYIKSQLKKQYKLKQIPNELVDLKVKQLSLIREIKKVKEAK